MKKCFIFAAGSFYGIKIRPKDGDLIIAADAGYKYCLREKIIPDVILGDFDSSEMPEDFANLISFPVEKDDTDTMLAVKEGLKRGCTEFYIYAGTGGDRLDHTLANFQVLIYLANNNSHGYLFDRSLAFTAIKDEKIIVEGTRKNALLSIFCFGSKAKNVSLSGVQYPLENSELTSAFPLGVSNHITEPTATVSVKNGTLVIGWELENSNKINILYEGKYEQKNY